MSAGFSPTSTRTRIYAAIKDFAKYPELRWLNRHEGMPPWIYGIAAFLIGGWSGLVVGFFWSTVLLWHTTFLVNSAAHVFGRRRYETTDTSRNSLIIALLTGGEGWHNNHHHYQASARQGFFWWEIDPTYYGLVVMSWFGIVKDLKKPPNACCARAPIPSWNPNSKPPDARLTPRHSHARSAPLGGSTGRCEVSGSMPARARDARMAKATIVRVGP